MNQLIFPMKEQYEEYTIDESKFTGYADSVSFPENEEEIQNILRELAEENIPVTIQGGKTGITGASIPMGGHIMNLSRMNRVKDSGQRADGGGYITVEPGINLLELRKEVDSLFRNTPAFWPPDPTETSASVGGIAALGAQGITSLLYGKTRKYIESLVLIDYKGHKKICKRGDKLKLSSGKEVETLDAVLGREGVTGIISEITLTLLSKPESIWGIAFFFAKEADAGKFIDLLKKDMPQSEGASVAAVEYLDEESIRLVEQRKSTITMIKELPEVKQELKCMVYTEIHGQEDAIEEIAEGLMEVALICDSDPDEAWAVSGEAEIDKMHAFRHGVAESANLCIEEARRTDDRIRKLGTDMTLCTTSFMEIVASCREDLKAAGINGCIFGHALENHLHVNLFPKNFEQYEKGKLLIRNWASQAVKSCGRIGTEHGFGKLKQEVLGEWIPETFIEESRELKEIFDSGYHINQGNIFKEQEA